MRAEAGEVNEVKKVKGAEEVKEVKDRSAEANGARVGAFFDLDGTLTAGPSLERRFFRSLRYRRVIGVRNYLLWLGEAVRLAPSGVLEIMQGNKMYLRGVRVSEGDAWIAKELFGSAESGREQIEIAGDTGEMRRGQARRWCDAGFFPGAAERVAWHARQGHAIVIVSGTLEPLARVAARSLEAQVGRRGGTVEVHALATRLEEAAGSWTGRILGEAMFGAEKARAIGKLARDWGLDLARSYAYGDSANDRWMLAAVGRPAAVNAGEELRRIARLHGWPEMRWDQRRSEAPARFAGVPLAAGVALRKKEGNGKEMQRMSLGRLR